METISIKIAPGKLSDPNYSPFKIPVVDWQNANSFLIQFSQIDADTLSWVEWGQGQINDNSLDLYNFVQNAKNWQTETYPKLKKMAGMVHQFGSTTIISGISEIEKFAPNFKSGNYSPGDSSQFIGSLNQVSEKVAPISIASQDLKITTQQIVAALGLGEKFLEAINAVKSKFAAKNYTKPNPAAQQLVQRMTDLENVFNWTTMNKAFQTFGYMDGTLGTFNSELNNAISKVDKLTYSKNPFIVDGQFDVAKDDWQQVATDAQNFLSNMP